jgi:small subunit ribosomal protein S6
LDTVNRLPRDYELMAILIPDMSEEDTQAALGRVTSYVTDVNADVTDTLTDSPWGRRRLAYTIRHEGVDYRDGFYVLIHFTGAPNSITEIERELKLDTSVIRYLLVSHDPKAGEKITDQPEGDAAEAPASDDAATAAGDTGATEAAQGDSDAVEAAEGVPAVEDETAEAAAEETPVDAPVSGTEAAVVEEAAEAIEGEDEPAPADGAESDNKES